MGGSLKVVVRETDGAIHSMQRWTNNLTWWLHRPSFINRPELVMQEYIEAKSQSPYYQENDTLSPSGYGLVVIDLKSKTILTHQNYTSLNQIYGASWALDLKLNHSLDENLTTSDVPFINLNLFRKRVQETNAIFSNLGLSNDEEQEIKNVKAMYELFMMGAITTCPLKVVESEKDFKDKFLKKATLDQLKKIHEVLGENKTRTTEEWKTFLTYINAPRHVSYFNLDLGFKVINLNSNNSEFIAKDYKKFSKRTS